MEIKTTEEIKKENIIHNHVLDTFNIVNPSKKWVSIESLVLWITKNQEFKQLDCVGNCAIAEALFRDGLSRKEVSASNQNDTGDKK